MPFGGGLLPNLNSVSTDLPRRKFGHRDSLFLFDVGVAFSEAHGVSVRDDSGDGSGQGPSFFGKVAAESGDPSMKISDELLIR